MRPARREIDALSLLVAEAGIEVTGPRAKLGSPRRFKTVDTVNCVHDDVDIVNVNY